MRASISGPIFGGRKHRGERRGLSLRGTIQRSRDVVVDGASSHSHRDSSRSGSKYSSLYSRVIARFELCSGFFFSFRSWGTLAAFRCQKTVSLPLLKIATSFCFFFFLFFLSWLLFLGSLRNTGTTLEQR